MLLPLVLIVLNGPPPEASGCALSGTVELRRKGEPVSPEGRVVVSVDGKVAGEENRSVTHSIQQIGLLFKPAMLVVKKGDSVEFVNEDTEAHSVFSNSRPIPFELPKSKRGVTGTQKFLAAGPMRILCDVHHWMRADILVLENRHFAVADANGKWRIAGLPAGDHTLTVWEPNGATTKVAVKQCDAPTKVEVPPLDEKPEPKKGQRKTGGVAPEY